MIPIKQTLPKLGGLAVSMISLCVYSEPSYAQVVDLTSTFQGMYQAGRDYLEALQQENPFASVQYSVVQGYIGQIDALASGQPYQYCGSARRAYSFAEQLAGQASQIGYAVAPPYSPTSILVAQQCSQIGQ